VKYISVIRKIESNCITLCAGSGEGLPSDALYSAATLFITNGIKYHKEVEAVKTG